MAAVRKLKEELKKMPGHWWTQERIQQSHNMVYMPALQLVPMSERSKALCESFLVHDPENLEHIPAEHISAGRLLEIYRTMPPFSGFVEEFKRSYYNSHMGGVGPQNNWNVFSWLYALKQAPCAPGKYDSRPFTRSAELLHRYDPTIKLRPNVAMPGLKKALHSGLDFQLPRQKIWGAVSKNISTTTPKRTSRKT